MFHPKVHILGKIQGLSSFAISAELKKISIYFKEDLPWNILTAPWKRRWKSCGRAV